MNMERLATFGFIALIFGLVGAPPVKEKVPEDEQVVADELDNTTLTLEYERYLQEVVNILESDPDFKAKLEKAKPDDIKTGKIADELDFVNHNIRSKLNEAKRLEVERLREAIRRQIEVDNGTHNIKLPQHFDHGNLETFEKADLQKLIHQTTADLEELDRKRQEEFKVYEMEKERKRREELAKLPEEERKKAEEEYEKQQAKHKEHEKVVHPGSKDQLQEVWEDVDKLPKEAFDMRTFFNLHDLTGDGFLDQDELEALFQKELDKVYDANATEDDMREREEEQARMREHVMKEMDLNKDGLISLEEFLGEQKDPNFEKDPGWESIGEGRSVFNEEELKNYEQQLHKVTPDQRQRLEPQAPGAPSLPNQAAQAVPPQNQQVQPQHVPQQNQPHPAVQQPHAK